MSARRNAVERAQDRAKILSTAARMFLEEGCEAASARKIAQAKEFVKRFDYPTIAEKTIEDMLAMLQQAQAVPVM